MRKLIYTVTEFEGSVLKNSIVACNTKKGLNAHLQGAISAVKFHEKHNNPCQVKFFQDAIKFIEKRL